MLSIADIKRSTYYYNVAEQNKIEKYHKEKKEIINIFTHNYNSYGYRRIHMALRSRGYTINHKTVAKLMKILNIKGKIRKSKYRSYKGNVGKLAPNLLNRQFACTRPNTKWVTDVTEFSLQDSKVYLSPIMDLYNREIISYSISRIANFAQTKNMLADAIAKLMPGDTPILHSDQGWQYQMKDYQIILSSNGITQSMSRKGNCLDNSCMENFFGRLKIEMFYGRKYDDSEHFIKELHKYMFYHNNQRISAKTKGMSPIDYRKHSYMIN